MAELGINVAPDAAPAALAATGAKWIRCVYREWLKRSWLEALRSHGIDPLLVGDSSPDSLGKDERKWSTRMEDARTRYGDLVKYWSWGNEPDGSGPASWAMDAAQVNRLLAAARAAFPKDKFTLVFPGLVSGQPNWLNSVNYWLADVLDVHPYNKDFKTPEQRDQLDFMLRSYWNYRLPVWAGEFDSRTLGLSGYLRDHPNLQRACIMCWDSGMTKGEGLDLGLIQNNTAMADFVAAAGGPVVVPPVVQPPAPPAPPTDTFSVGPGMRALMAKRGDVPGSDEIYYKNAAGVDQWSECVAKSGRTYRYLFSNDTTFSYAPEAA